MTPKELTATIDDIENECHFPPFGYENLWNPQNTSCGLSTLLREAVVNKVWTTLSELEEVLVKRCRWFSENRKKVQAHVGFQWICKIENNANPVNLV